MARVHVSAKRAIPAPADAVYALLADYRLGHPSILPCAFSDFEVLEGGTGGGTVIRYRLNLAGQKRQATARVAEPEPGRVLAETVVDTGAVTTFTVTPSGAESILRFDTVWESRHGLAGIIERLLAPRILGRIFAEEMDLIERWAKRQRQNPRGGR